MFEKASRLKLRFDTGKGALSVEDLWDLPLTSTVGKANLDDIAIKLNKQLKSVDAVSFVNTDQKSDAVVQLKFDIAKYIIEVRVEENKKELERKANKEKKQQILAIIAQKEYEQTAGSSIEELRRLADSL